eukprot:9499945-Pyramimonas_sp.AAC.1
MALRPLKPVPTVSCPRPNGARTRTNPFQSVPERSQSVPERSEKAAAPDTSCRAAVLASRSLQP